MTNARPASVRDAWTDYVTADDYDAHMARNGQARANAVLVESLLAGHPPGGDRLLVAGAGTGQLLDFAPGVLAGRRTTFTDINPAFLARLAARAAAAGHPVETVVDDLEDSRLSPEFDAAIVVLVFEHIDWRRGVASLARLGPEQCYIIIQENPAGAESPIAARREPVGTMRAFVDVHPTLVPPADLHEAFQRHGYLQVGLESVDVPDGKRMIGTVFRRS